MSAKRDGLAESVHVRLVQHAKKIGVDPNLVITRYAVERFLYRLSQSPYADRFVLKGALLLLAWLGETLRPTRDADLLGFGDLEDDELLTIFRDVCQTTVEPDAAHFDSASVVIEPIREGNDYGGHRISFRGRVGTARVGIQVDIGIGDAVTPAAEWLDYPSLLEFSAPRLRAYTRESVIAEKLHAIIVLGLQNSRMKDYFDIRALLMDGNVDSGILAQAVSATFRRRSTPIPTSVPSGLTDAFSEDYARQTQWDAFLRRNRLDAPSLRVTVKYLREQLAPVIAVARTLIDV